VIGQGVGQVAENVKSLVLLVKILLARQVVLATRAQMLDDAEVMAEVQRRFGAAALEPYICCK